MNDQTSNNVNGGEGFFGEAPQAQAEPTLEEEFRQQIGDSTEAAFQGLIELDTTPPDNVAEYNMGFAENEADTLSPEFVAVDTEVRDMLRTAQMPANIANSLARTANSYVEYSQHFTPEQHEIERRTTMSKLERLYGEDLGKKLEMARSFIKTLDSIHNGLMTEILETHGLGNSVEVVHQIIQHAERIALVKKARTSKILRG